MRSSQFGPLFIVEPQKVTLRKCPAKFQSNSHNLWILRGRKGTFEGILKEFYLPHWNVHFELNSFRLRFVPEKNVRKSFIYRNNVGNYHATFTLSCYFACFQNFDLETLDFFLTSFDVRSWDSHFVFIRNMRQFWPSKSVKMEKNANFDVFFSYRILLLNSQLFFLLNSKLFLKMRKSFI